MRVATWTSGIALALSLLAGGRAMGQTRPVEDDSNLGPMCEIHFPSGTWVGKTVFSADGEKLYAYVTGSAINIWEVGVYYWPEVVGGLLILTAVPTVFWVRRIARTLRIVGELHCRHCNYCLKDLAGDRCPECGEDIRRPIRGRRQWVRLVPAWACLVVLTIFYGGLWAMKAPRTGWVSNWVNWWSPSLLDWAKDKNVNWLSARAQQVSSINVFDVRAGNLVGVLDTAKRKPSLFGWTLEKTPDGRGLILADGEDDALVIVDPDSGCTVKRLELPELGVGWGSRWISYGGMNDDGTKVYVTATDERHDASNLIEWNLSTGEWKKILSVPAERLDIATNRSVLDPTRFIAIPGSDGRRFVETPRHVYWSGQNRTADWNVHDLADSQSEIRTFQIRSRQSSPRFNAAGTFAIIDSIDEGDLAWIDLSSGKRRQQRVLPKGCSWASAYDIDSSNQRLVCNAAWRLLPLGRGVDLILVEDLASGKWIGSRVLPPGYDVTSLRLAPEGRYVALGAQMSKPPYLPTIFIYDLGRLHPIDFESYDDYNDVLKRIKKGVTTSQRATSRQAE